MSPKVFLGWAVVALLTLAGAIVATASRPETSVVRLVNEPAFPALRDNPDAAARVVLRNKEGSVTLERGQGTTWRVLEKGDYPADENKVRALIVGLADMQLVEAKTSHEDRFGRLEVEDVAAEDAKSRSLRIEGGDGKTLVATVVGKTRSRFTGGREGGTYLRRDGDDRAWLASGRLDLKAEPAEWLARDILDLSADRIRSVVVTPAGGEAYTLSRTEPETDWTLDLEVPEGRVLDADAIGRVSSGLGRLTLQDVKPLTGAELPEQRYESVYTTFDGLQVTAELAKGEDDSWAWFSAAYVGETGDESEAAQRRAEAEEINARLAGWAYQLPGYIAKRLTTSFEELHKAAGGTS